MPYEIEFADNARAHLRELTAAQRKTVLDLCCYSGGWGFNALKAGAEHVTFVDESKDALQLVEQGLALNDFSKTVPRLSIW